MTLIATAVILYIAFMAFLIVSLFFAMKADTHPDDRQEDEEQRRFIEEWMKKKQGPK